MNLPDVAFRKLGLVGASLGYFTTSWKAESGCGVVVVIGTGSQDEPELIRGTHPVSSSCLRVDSGKKFFSFSSSNPCEPLDPCKPSKPFDLSNPRDPSNPFDPSNPCEPDRNGKGVLGLLLFIEASVLISKFFGISLFIRASVLISEVSLDNFELSVFLSCPGDGS